MKNSESGIVPVAAVCDRRRTDPKNPAGRWSVAAFVRKPQIEPVTPTVRAPRQSSLIKPNQAISCLHAIQSQPPSPSTSSNPSMSSTRVHQIRNPQWEAELRPILNFSKTPSKPVKASQSVFQSLPSGHDSSRSRNILWSHRPKTQPIAFFSYSILQFSRAIRTSRQTQTNQPDPIDPTDPTASRNPQFCEADIRPIRNRRRSPPATLQFSKIKPNKGE